ATEERDVGVNIGDLSASSFFVDSIPTVWVHALRCQSRQIWLVKRNYLRLGVTWPLGRKKRQGFRFRSDLPKVVAAQVICREIAVIDTKVEPCIIGIPRCILGELGRCKKPVGEFLS